MAGKGFGSSFDFKPSGWKQLQAMLDPAKFSERLHKNVRRATQFNGMLVQREVRERVYKVGYHANAPLTIIIKGSSKPLVDDNELMRAVTSRVIDDFNVFVGVLRSAKGSDGELFNLAVLLHEGGNIPVTTRMRNMFMLLWFATKAGATAKDIAKLEGRALEIYKDLNGRGTIYPLKATTDHITIPPRPYLKTVFEDPDVLKKVQDNWRKAVENALR